jgi:hypothetical protein
MKYLVLPLRLFICVFAIVAFTTLHFLWDFKIHRRYYRHESKEILRLLKDKKYEE